MEARNSSKPVAQIVSAIQALDLDPIKVKLMGTDEGHGWSREYADQMEVAYKRFLTLLVAHPETTVAPSKEIDKFWHAHILDTMKYAEDCQQVFGYFLHHFPYFGLRGADDAAQLEQAGQEMERLYQQEFGEAMPVSAAAQSAFCFAAKPATQAAFCFAAKPVAISAFCFAVKPAANSAFCFASGTMNRKQPDSVTRPALALAA
jgi:hypothetical protein